MTGDKEKIHVLQQELIDYGFLGTIKLDVPLAPMTYYKIGGPAAILVQATSIEDLILVQRLLDEHSIPRFVLGAGTNILVADEGYMGCVIQLAGDFEKMDIAPDIRTINAGAAVPLLKIIREGSRIGLGGIERLAGIPGWIGGAVHMNAGTFGEYIDDLLDSVDVLTPSNQLLTLAPGECLFAYRTSRFQETGEIIIGCTIVGEPEDPGSLDDEIERRLERRKISQPVDIPSCGCAFRNPTGKKSAGQLIQEADLKGVRVGDAVISDLHGNFIVNEGNALASDIIALMALARKRVFDHTGLRLVPEVRGVGFPEPLEVMLDAQEND